MKVCPICKKKFMPKRKDQINCSHACATVSTRNKLKYSWGWGCGGVYGRSMTGDLGVAQINWPINGKMIKEKLGYSPADMFDVKKNIDSAYLIWDRGDGEEGNKGNL